MLNLFGRRSIDQIPAPDLGLVRASRVPHRNRARLARMQSRVREDLAGTTSDPAPFAPLFPSLGLAFSEVLGDGGRMLVGGRRRLALGQDINSGLVAALGKGDVQPARHLALLHIPTAGARGTDADQVDRAVRDVVIAVAAEILGREFPIAWDAPFLDAAEDLGAAIAAIPAVEGQVEKAHELAKIFEKRGCLRIPIGPDRTLVAAHLCHLDEAPLRLVELGMIGLTEIGHAGERAVGAIAPAVIGAGEDGCAALVVAALLHSAMAARVEEHVHLPSPVAAQERRLLAHARDEEVARIWDLALVSNE